MYAITNNYNSFSFEQYLNIMICTYKKSTIDYETLTIWILLSNHKLTWLNDIAKRNCILATFGHKQWALTALAIQHHLGSNPAPLHSPNPIWPSPVSRKSPVGFLLIWEIRIWTPHFSFNTYNSVKANKNANAYRSAPKGMKWQSEVHGIPPRRWGSRSVVQGTWFAFEKRETYRKRVAVAFSSSYIVDLYLLHRRRRRDSIYIISGFKI